MADITKDWERRPYVSKKGFPEVERRRTAKEKWNAVLEVAPDAAEFNGGIVPTERIIKELLAQSEHKKPYASDSYGEMEYDLEAPPGFGPELPPGWVPPPGVPWPGGPGLEDVIDADPGRYVFDITPEIITSPIEEQTGDGDQICSGVWTRYDLQPTHTVVSVQLLNTPPGMTFTYPNAGNKSVIDIWVPGDVFGGGFIIISANMVVEGTSVTGNSTANVLLGQDKEPGCPSQYAIINVDLGGGYVRSFVWDFWRSEIPNDIKQTDSGPTVIFPALPAQLSYWTGLVSGIGFQNIKQGGQLCTWTQDPIISCGVTGLASDGNSEDHTRWRCNGSQFYDSRWTCSTSCTYCNPVGPPWCDSFGQCTEDRREIYPLGDTFSNGGSGGRAYGWDTQEGTWDQVLMYNFHDVVARLNCDQPGPVCQDTGGVFQVSQDVSWYVDIDGVNLGGYSKSNAQITQVNANKVMLASNFVNPDLPTEPMNPDSLIHLDYMGAKFEDYPLLGNPDPNEIFYAYVDYDHKGFVFNTTLNRTPLGASEVAITNMIAGIVNTWKLANPGILPDVTFGVQLLQGHYKTIQ